MGLLFGLVKLSCRERWVGIDEVRFLEFEVFLEVWGVVDGG